MLAHEAGTFKSTDSKTVIPDSRLFPPPPDIHPIWESFVADPSDATSRIVFGQILNERRDFLNPIIEDHTPGWFLYRQYCLTVLRSPVPGGTTTVRLLRPDLLDREGKFTAFETATRVGASTMFNRWAFAAEYPDHRSAERAARTLAVLGLSWVLTLKPRPRVTWVASCLPPS